MTDIAPLAITMGDASGIGPEIVAKTLARVALYARLLDQRLLRAYQLPEETLGGDGRAARCPAAWR